MFTPVSDPEPDPDTDHNTVSPPIAGPVTESDPDPTNTTAYGNAEDELIVTEFATELDGAIFTVAIPAIDRPTDAAFGSSSTDPDELISSTLPSELNCTV